MKLTFTTANIGMFEVDNKIYEKITLNCYDYVNWQLLLPIVFRSMIQVQEKIETTVTEPKIGRIIS